MSDDEINNDDDLGAELEFAAKKLGIDINVLREVSPEEIQYLLDHCPYLQVVDTVLHYIDEDPPEVKLIDAESSGWKILDYGDAMSSSPGENVLGFSEYKRVLDKEGNDDGGDGGDKGTIWNQAFLTAAEIVSIAKARGWKGIQIVDGHRVMKRGAWIKALQEGMPVVGFEPSSDDEKVRKRVEMDANAYEVLRHKSRPKR